jgi:hypothetical protein
MTHQNCIVGTGVESAPSLKRKVDSLKDTTTLKREAAIITNGCELPVGWRVTDSPRT